MEVQYDVLANSHVRCSAEHFKQVRGAHYGFYKQYNPINNKKHII